MILQLKAWSKGVNGSTRQLNACLNLCEIGKARGVPNVEFFPYLAVRSPA